MSILAAIYESGAVEEVDMADVIRLFGAQPESGLETRFSFRDEDWVEAYIDFREQELKATIAIQATEDFGSVEDLLNLQNWEPPGKSN